MKGGTLCIILLGLILTACRNPKPPISELPKPDKILVTYYTDFDVANSDSVTITSIDSMNVTNSQSYKITNKEYDVSKQLWCFNAGNRDSLPIKFDYSIILKNDSAYKAFHVSEIELGKHGAYAKGCTYCYFWEIHSYLLDGKLFEDSNIYLTSEKVFRDLHSWQR